VEIAFPIDDANIKARLMNILNITLSDNVKLRELLPDGSYKRAKKRKNNAVSAHIALHMD
jgi:polyphosphate kinase